MSKSENLEQLTLFAVDSRVKTSPLLESVRGCLGDGVAFSGNWSGWLGDSGPDGSLSRTSLVSCLRIRAKTSLLHSRRLPNAGMVWRGECWTANISECPNDAVESSLSDILERRVHPKYSLSPKAARGILRRAEKRGKKLPERLAEALESVAGVLTPTERHSSPAPSEQEEQSQIREATRGTSSPTAAKTQAPPRPSDRQTPTPQGGRTASGGTAGRGRKSPSSPSSPGSGEMTGEDTNGSLELGMTESPGRSRPHPPETSAPGPKVIRTVGDYDNPRIVVDDKPMLAANPMSDREMAVFLESQDSPQGNRQERGRSPTKKSEARPSGDSQAEQTKSPRSSPSKVAPALIARMEAKTGTTQDRMYEATMLVRRLTPKECERLQGFPDGWTCLCSKSVTDKPEKKG